MKYLILFAILSLALSQNCVQDSYSPNQSQQTAYVVSPVTQTLNGVLCSDTEVDWYTFSQNYGEYISAFIIYNRTYGNPDMEGFQQGVAGSVTSTNNLDYDIVTLLNGNQGTATIYLRIYQSTCGYVQGAGVNYTLQIQRYQGNCTDDINLGLNTNRTTAVQAIANNFGVLCRSYAEDWYKFTLQVHFPHKISYLKAGTSLDLTLVYAYIMMDQDVQLFDAAMNSLAYSYTPSIEHITYSVTTTGTYYVQVITYSALYSPQGGYYALLVRGGGAFPAISNPGCTRPGGSTTGSVTTGQQLIEQVTTGRQVTSGRQQVTTGVQGGQQVTTGIQGGQQVTTGVQGGQQVTTSVAQVTTGTEMISQTGTSTGSTEDSSTSDNGSSAENSGEKIIPSMIACFLVILILI